jgi:hypothetical protein
MTLAIMIFANLLFYNMLKRQIMIATHMGSGGSMLLEMILANRKAARLPRSYDQVYADPTSLSILQEDANRFRPHARLFVDKVMFNFEVINLQYLQMCEYIFLVREAKGSLNSIVKSGKLTPEAATRYYTFRLRRLCEMAKKSPRRLVITWDDLVDKSCLASLRTYLGMKELPSFYRAQEEVDLVDPLLVMQGQKSYEKHLQYLKAITSLDAKVLA